MNRYVEGSYQTQEEALQAIQRLREQGYQSEEIYLVANAEVLRQLPDTTEGELVEAASVVGQDVDQRSFWEKIKDVFTVDEYRPETYREPDYETDKDPLYAYQEELNRGSLVIMITEEKDLEENQNTNALYPDQVTDADVLADIEDRGMSPTTEQTRATGTGRSGTPAHDAFVNDLNTAKSSDILPGQDGDSFRSESLESDVVEEMEVPEVDHPYTPNPALKKMSPDEIWDDNSTLDRDGVTGVDSSNRTEE